MSSAPTPADVELANTLRSAIGELVRSYRGRENLSPGSAAVLGLLDREGPTTVADLAARRRVRHQSMTATVAELRDEGLLSVGPHPDDARKKLVTITAAGRRALTVLRRGRNDRMAVVIAELTARERAVLAEAATLLDRVTASVQAGQAAEPRRRGSGAG